jgi:hypothetical protein
VSDSRLQEIMTKAVVGRAERRIAWNHTLTADGITGVFGVHITDATIGVKHDDGRPAVDLLVDCDLWCGSGKGTKVIRCTARLHQRVEVPTFGHVLGEPEVSAKMIGLPRATGVSVNDGQISLALEADVVVELSALARMWVKAYSLDDAILSDLDDPEGNTGYSAITGTSSGSFVGE